jgi:glycerophosphoryl diester phosphodiesterase
MARPVRSGTSTGSQSGKAGRAGEGRCASYLPPPAFLPDAPFLPDPPHLPRVLYNPGVMTVARSCLLLTALLVALAPIAFQGQTRKQSIAHRGASGSAPEHTAAAYRLAIDQHVDFVEQDLGVTRDNQLICIHDDTLERTTNVAEVFPDRASTDRGPRTPGKRWLVNDFTLDEIRRLDAGRWFRAEFAGARIQTFQEAIDLVRGKAGLYPELKSPQLYTSRGIDQVALFVEVVRRNGLEKPASLRTTPLIIQSFDEDAIRRVATELPTVPRILLIERDGDVSDARLRAVKAFATGIGPQKSLVAKNPGMVKAAHDLGMTVTSWTFRADEKTTYPTVREEMAHFLYDLGLDALFTNNPDQFPRR